MEAFAFNTRTTREDEFRCAKGESVEYFGVPQKQWSGRLL
jgi:hypothetical protein